MWRLCKGQLWILGVGCFLLFASISLGVMFREQLRNHSRGNDNVLDFDYEEEEEEQKPLNLMEELSCLDIGQTFRGFWDCMVEGLPRSPKEPPSRAPGVFHMKKLNVSANATSRRKRRVKRHSDSNTSHYVPADLEMVFTLDPVTQQEWKDEEFRQQHNDYTKVFSVATSEYLFDFNPDPRFQSNPSWSYHGSLSPKEWHTLDIEKFFTPLNDNLSPRQAMFRDLAIEKEYLLGQIFYFDCYYYFARSLPPKDEKMCEDLGLTTANFREEVPRLISKYLQFIQRVSTLYLGNHEAIDHLMPPEAENEEAKKALDNLPNLYYQMNVQGDAWDQYVENIQRRLEKMNMEFEEYFKREKLDYAFDYTKDNASNGFYSSMRFLLPPTIPDAELTALRREEKTGLPKDFVRANKNALRLNEYLIYLRKAVFDDTKNKTINREKQRALAEIFNASYIERKFFLETIFKTEEEVLQAGYNLIKKDIQEGEDELLERERYSLPLFPVQFKICSHNDQSPININTSTAIHAAIGPFSFGENACRRYEMRVSFPSDGTNILSVKLEGSTRIMGTAVTLEEGAIRGEMLYFDEMHVHIGQDETRGSEHRLNGKGYAMELQLIFSLHGADSLSPYYFTLARQMNDLFPVREQLVLIIAVFVEVVEKPENIFLFEPLAQAASRFRQEHEKATAKGKEPRGYHFREPVMSIREFIPDSIYYTYRGSLTIPPCFPYVIWSVYEKPLQISREQYEEIRLWPTPSADDRHFLAGNVRDPEDIYSEEEHVVGISQEKQDWLKEIRNNRLVLKSNPSGWNADYYTCSSNSDTNNCGSLQKTSLMVLVFTVAFVVKFFKLL